MGGPGSGRRKGSGKGKATKSKGLVQKQTKESRRADKMRGYKLMALASGKKK
jgi:hypothetical protein